MTVAWIPALTDVAKYVPRRTIVGAVDGYGNALNTFDTTTRPNATAVTALIADAVAWIQVKVGTADTAVHVTLNAAATQATAKYAAAMVELTYPDNRDDIGTAQVLLAEAKAARDDLWRANIAVTGTDVEDPAAHLVPVYSFPAPMAWGDTEFD